MTKKYLYTHFPMLGQDMKICISQIFFLYGQLCYWSRMKWIIQLNIPQKSLNMEWLYVKSLLQISVGHFVSDCRNQSLCQLLSKALLEETEYFSFGIMWPGLNNNTAVHNISQALQKICEQNTWNFFLLTPYYLVFKLFSTLYVGATLWTYTTSTCETAKLIRILFIWCWHLFSATYRTKELGIVSPKWNFRKDKKHFIIILLETAC